MAETPEQLDDVARGHHQSEGFTPRLIDCRARTLERLLPARARLLDLGCADGLLTARLGRRHPRVLGVDASSLRIDRADALTRELETVELRRALFEELDVGEERFDGIVLSCVLEHHPDPPALLSHAAGWLAPGGRLVAIVPHGHSLHRRAGVLMGLLRGLEDHGEADHELEHERIYDAAGLAADFRAAGLEVVAQGGHLLKPLPNDRMADLPPELVDAYEELGRQLPDLAAEIWAAGERG